MAEAGGVYRCAHPMIADVVRSDLTASRRREVHRALALALQDITAARDAREVARDIARHAERGDEPAVAYKHALLASEAATARYAFEEVLSWLDLAAGVSGSEDRANEVNRRTGDVLQQAGWTEPPRPLQRPGTPARGFDRTDLDLQGPEAPSA